MAGRRIPGPLGAMASGGLLPGWGEPHPGKGSFEFAGPIGINGVADVARPGSEMGSVSRKTPAGRARTLVQSFAARSQLQAFVNVRREKVAAGLIERIDNPGIINQQMTSLCGPAALLFDIASRDPVRYARFGINLYELGEAHLAKLFIEPGSDLKEYSPPPTIDAADWVTMASIRDSENWFFDYDEVSDELAGITLPGELAGWFEKVGYSDVRNETNLVFNKGEGNARQASSLSGQRFRVCLFIGANMLYAHKHDEGTATADHWVVLASSISFQGPNVSLNVFTWGEGKRPVPQGGSVLSLESFLDNYYGYVAARF